MLRFLCSGDNIAWRRSGLVLGLAGFTALCWAIDHAGIAGHAIPWWSDGAWTAIAILAGLQCRAAARSAGAADRIAWTLFALGCLSWALGMVLWDWNELVLGQATPFPGLSDIGFLALAPIFAVGLLFYRPGTITRGLALVQTGNLLVITATLLVVVPIAFYGLVFRTSGGLPRDGGIYLITALAYPVLYLSVVLFGLYSAIFYPWGTKRLVVTLLILSLLIHAFVSSLYCQALLFHRYETGGRYDYLWVLSFALIWWAAFEQSVARPGGRAEPGRIAPGRLSLIEAFVTPLAVLVIAVTTTLSYRALSPEVIRVLALIGLSLPLSLGFKEWAMHGLQGTLRRQAEASLAEVQESEQRYRALFASIRDGILLFRPDRTILSANAAACRMLAYDEKELLNRDYHLIVDMADPRLKPALAEHFQSGRFEGEVAMMRKSGERFPVEVSSSFFGSSSEPYACVVVRDISERVRERAELIAAKEEAEAGSRAKSQFLAHMSHELRTPLNAIIGFSEMMTARTHGPLGSAKYDEYAGYVLNSGRHLLAIINDILDLAKVEAGRYELVASEIDLADFLRGLVALFAERAKESGLSLILETADDLPKLVADARLLRQVLFNLLSNATKFTPPGGRIEIVARPIVAGSLGIQVTDTGVGIAEEDLTRVLQPFGQARGGIARPFEGTGLGLPLAKAFMELHGGTLALASQPGQGTCVTVTMPAERLRHRLHQLG